MRALVPQFVARYARFRFRQRDAFHRAAVANSIPCYGSTVAGGAHLRQLVCHQSFSTLNVRRNVRNQNNGESQL